MNDSAEKIPEQKTEFAWSEIEGQKLILERQGGGFAGVYKADGGWHLATKAGAFEIKHFGASEMKLDGLELEIGKELLKIRGAVSTQFKSITKDDFKLAREGRSLRQ